MKHLITAMKQILFLIFIFATISVVKSQTFDKEKLDRFINLVEENNKCMGSFSLFQDGKEVYQNSFGFADVASDIKVNKETKFRIGSISKTFTATMIMQLFEEKKLSLDTKLSEYFPGIPNAKKITIEQLLRHRTGLFNFTNKEDYTTWMVKPQTRKDILNHFIKNGTVFEPGEKMEYSNTNYVLLSFIIEEIEKKPYSEVLKSRITGPLKLDNTYYGEKINSAEDEAFSYSKQGGWQLETETDMSVPSGAGAIVSMPTDLNRFFNALFNMKLVSEESLGQMEKMVDGYGFALTSVPFYEKKAFGHGGGIDGFRSFAAYFPVEKTAFSLTCNGLDMVLNDLMIGILSIYFGRDYELPDFAAVVKVDISKLTSYEGLYSSPDLPLKLKIFIEDGVLKGQGTGQPSFPLEAFEENKFRFDQAGLEIEFLPEKNKMILKQGGATFELTKE
ncbi:MAG: beta-lactamase family protein [Prolixibacteraceae bacterium]|nr:beta-lactamase family protein [Prolixibacteraceae bacterium]MBN2775927.1 beta-lactamase family protein [Prolixibacteraceae bacterium]